MADSEELVVEWEAGTMKIQSDEDGGYRLVHTYDGGQGSPPGWSDMWLTEEAAVKFAEFILKSEKLRVFYTDDFDRFYPARPALVITAENMAEAMIMLGDLVGNDLRNGTTIHEVDISKKTVHIFDDEVFTQRSVSDE